MYASTSSKADLGKVTRETSEANGSDVIRIFSVGNGPYVSLTIDEAIRLHNDLNKVLTRQDKAAAAGMSRETALELLADPSIHYATKAAFRELTGARPENGNAAGRDPIDAMQDAELVLRMVRAYHADVLTGV